MSATESASHVSWGVTKPVGHVLASFPTEGDARSAAEELRSTGFDDASITMLTAAQMKVRTEADIHKAGILASLGQELNLVKAQHELAVAGYTFLSVRAPGQERAHQVADVARRHHACRAQRYGHLIIEELIEPGTGERQVAESPDRGLDAQTPSGRERA